MAKAYLRWGVTTAMVTGTRNDTGIADRDAVEHGIFAAPRLYQGFLNLARTRSRREEARQLRARPR